MDAVSQSRADELHPVLRSRVTATVNDCEAVGIYLRITQGKRKPNEQHALFLQGREPLDVVNEARAAVGWAAISSEENQHTVTDADWFESLHVFALAADVDPSKPGFPKFNPDWDVQDEQWQKVLQIAASHGLAEGAKWTMKKRDYPHLYPQELDASPTLEMKQTFKDAGLAAVWAEVNRVLGVTT